MICCQRQFSTGALCAATESMTSSRKHLDPSFFVLLFYSNKTHHQVPSISWSFFCSEEAEKNSEVHLMRLCLYVYNFQVARFYQLLIDERPTNLCLTFVSLHLCTTIIELKASAAPPSRSRSLPMVSACWVMCSWLCARHLCAVSPRLFFCRPAVLKVFRETLVGLLYLLTFSIC